MSTATFHPENKSSVLDEENYSYTNKYLEKQIQFEASSDEVVVSAVDAISSETLGALNAAEGSSVVLADPERGFAIMAVSDAVAMDSLKTELSGAGATGNVLPVMLDENGDRRYLMPDEFTVQFEESLDNEKMLEILSEHRADVVVDQRSNGYYTVAVPEGRGLFEMLGIFNGLSEVVFAEPSEIGVDDALTAAVDLTTADQDLKVIDDDELDVSDLIDDLDEQANAAEAFIATDPDLQQLWALRNVGQSVDGVTGHVDDDIDATLAWHIGTGSSRAVVVVIDTGADLDHPDLASRLMPRAGHDWDFDDPGDAVPWDEHYHGTHVAGTAVAAANRVGMVGVAPHARLIPLRINLTAGMNANRADAIRYVAKRARGDRSRNYVVNCSWRASGNMAAILYAIRQAVAADVLVIFAAGNDNRDMDAAPQYPGAWPEVMSVAASDQRDERASFSNYGSTVDITAPGVNIWSSVPDDSHAFLDGTSMAAPHVAGAAALVWSRNPALSAASVRRILERSTDNIDAENPGYVGRLGSGRLNAYKALRATPPPRVAPRPVRQFAFPQANVGSSTGLAFAPIFRNPSWGTNAPAVLFVTQQAGSERVYYLRITDGHVIWSMDPVNNDTIGSLSWANDQVWMANVTTGAGAINRVHKWTGQQLGSIPAPPGRGEGLVHVGSHVYYSTQSRIHVLDPGTGAVVRSFVPPGGTCRALAYGHGRLFLGNSASGRITVYNLNTRLVDVVLSAPGAGSRQVEGLAYDPRRRELYVANQSENRVYVVRV